jgi:phosphoenolpyruvate carboxylase
MYTIHDNIITTKKGALLVEKIIKDTYKELIGVEPDLRKEEMTPQNAFNEFNKYITKKTIEICKDLRIEYKEEKAKMTIEDLQDVVKSKCFKKVKPIELHDLIVVMPLPWEN